MDIFSLKRRIKYEDNIFMEVKNKMEKAFLSLASLFLVATVVLGFKHTEDNKKIAQLLESLNATTVNSGITSSQGTITQTREQILSTAANSPAKDIQQNVVTKTVVPGKVVAQTVPAASSSKSSNTTTSSPAKTTKTS